MGGREGRRQGEKGDDQNTRTKTPFVVKGARERDRKHIPRGGVRRGEGEMEERRKSDMYAFMKRGGDK